MELAPIAHSTAPRWPASPIPLPSQTLVPFPNPVPAPLRYTKARGMELVPNAHSAKMAREVSTFVSKFKCIPAFTANLTMENFQKQTAC